ncbi:MAG TPA: hypothetical protein VGD89_01980 [Flavipsychrobacter sp.]
MEQQPYRKPNDKATEMNTLSACMNKALQDGYTDNFKVTGQGLFAPSTEKSYRPEQIHVINFYRFEGESDPSDNSILYVIETDDGVKGMLNDAYGAYADEAVNKFMRQVEDMNKKVIKADKPN